MTDPENGEPLLLRYEDIVSVSSSGRQILVSSSIKDYLYSGKFSTITEILCGTGYFLKCNRNSVVNLRQIIRLEPWSNMRLILHMRSYNKTRIILSRSYLKEFRSMVGL